MKRFEAVLISMVAEETAAVLDALLADGKNSHREFLKAIEAALPFCSFWYKSRLLDKFLEVATFSNNTKFAD